MLALPFITERSDFCGVVYATEPSLNLGKLYMEELVTYIERNPKLKRATAWKKPNVSGQLPLLYFPDCAPPSNWETIYSMSEINSCLSKVKPVSFAEKAVSLAWFVFILLDSNSNCLMLFCRACLALFNGTRSVLAIRLAPATGSLKVLTKRLFTSPTPPR